jgi:hypothetical protein
MQRGGRIYKPKQGPQEASLAAQSRGLKAGHEAARETDVRENDGAAVGLPNEMSWDFGRLRINAPGADGRPALGKARAHLCRDTQNSPEHDLERGTANRELRNPEQREERVQRGGRSGTAGGPLLMGAEGDPMEAAARRAASAKDGAAPAASGVARFEGAAPGIVPRVLASPGRPLDGSSRRTFERRFGHDFSRVRVHADGEGARATRAVGAQAFTVGEHIVLGQTGAPEGLLAHELAHVLQQRAAQTLWVQRQTGGQPVPRKDYVFIMGKDKPRQPNQFFKAATLYFQSRLPQATMVTDRRSLEDLLAWVAANVKDPIGNLYIVSHGAEDGTLFFGLNAAGGKLTVNTLRDALHPQGGAPSQVTSVASVVDGQTRIHIKGCDIGQTQEIVELIDEAFGGAGTVTAPTHEQDYETDRTLGEQARKAEHDKDIAQFTATLPALPAAPAPVDPKLKGDAKKAAQQAHATAAAARKQAEDARNKAVAQEEQRIKPQLEATEKREGVVESISGPLFQRPGTQLYTSAELQPEVDRLYGHLSEDQRNAMVKKLVVPDRGTAQDQQGQKVERVMGRWRNFPDPATVAEAKVAFASQFRKVALEPKSMQGTQGTSAAGDAEMDYTFSGTVHAKGQAPSDASFPVTVPLPDQAEMLEQSKKQVNNPGKYAWRIERTHTAATGMTKVQVIGERVIAYLHHGSLDVGPHQHFTEPESNPDFYAKSAFMTSAQAAGAATGGGVGAAGQSVSGGATTAGKKP